MIAQETKMRLRGALINATDSKDKKELFRVLEISKTLGFKWSVTTLYEGASRIDIREENELVSQIRIEDTDIELSFHDLYFLADKEVA